MLKEREAPSVALCKIVSVNQRKKKKKEATQLELCQATSSPPNRNNASTLCMYLCMYSGRDTISVYSLATVQTKSELSCCLRCN